MPASKTKPKRKPTTGADRQARERLIRAATSLFSEKGFANVSVREICEQAATSLPMLYYYFKDKEGLFNEVVRGAVGLDALISELRRVLDAEPTPHQQLRAFVSTYLLRFPDETLTTGFYLRDSAGLDPASSRRLVADLDKITALTREFIAAGVARREFSVRDAHMAADCLLGMMNRFVFQRVHFRRAFNHKRAAEFVCDFFLRAIKPSRTTSLQPRHLS